MTVKNQTLNLFLLFLTLFLTTISWAQGWEKHFPLKDTTYQTNSRANLISSTADGGAIFVTEDIYPLPGDMNLTKIDQDGSVQWQKPLYEFGLPEPSDLIQSSDGNYVLTGISTGVFVKKFNANGQLIWEESLQNYSLNSGKVKIVETVDKGYLLSTPVLDTGLQVVLVKIDSVGTFEWDATFGSVLGFLKQAPIVIHPNNTYSLFFSEDLSKSIFKAFTFDSIGNLLGVKVFNNSNGMGDWGFYDAVSAKNGRVHLLLDEYNPNAPLKKVIVTLDSALNYISTSDSLTTNSHIYPFQSNRIKTTLDGGSISYVEFSNLTYFTSIVTKTDHLGNIEWSKTFPERFDYLDVSNHGTYYLTGLFQADKLRVIKLDGKGNLFGNFIIGNVVDDLNLNCQTDSSELGLLGILVEAKGNTSFYGITDSSGNYSIELDTGSYLVDVVPPNSFWGACNNDTVQVNAKDTITSNFQFKKLIVCPYLNLDISTPLLRRCFDNVYTVAYCNQGTIESINTTVTLDIHPHFDVISSSIPWSNQFGNSYKFQVGNLNVNDCGSFQVTVNPNCDSTIIGQTLCISGSVTPDSICIPPSPDWDGSITDLDVSCGTDSLTFTIKNIGLGSMSSALEYLVIQDNLISKQSFFQLNSLDSIQLKFPANGATYRLYAGQSPGYFPPGYNPTIAYEGCGTNANGTISIGYINMFPESGLLNTDAMDCQEIIGAYDPNDKHATPKGYSNEHYIEVGDDLNYRIRFQNTGTDTAFTVVIRDTISEHLDIASLIQGSYSHPYNLEIINGKVLKFTFNNILLPDSTTNEPASHGFVKFKISQQPNLPLGTMIYNSAAIYFDFNEPIITNETYHEIGEDFIPVVVTSVSSPTYPNISVAVQPNPFVHYAEFVLEGAPTGGKTFELYDALGILVRREAFTADSYHRFYKKDLSAGIYFYNILQEGKLLNSGKMIAGN